MDCAMLRELGFRVVHVYLCSLRMCHVDFVGLRYICLNNRTSARNVN